MKHIFTIIITLLSYCTYAQVVISDEKEDIIKAEEGAVLELRSADKGMLIPRLPNSDALKGNIVAGTIFYNLEEGCIQGWNGTKFIALSPCTKTKFQSLFSEDFQEFRGSGFKSM